MHLVDITMFFAPHSGGVKRYILSKRAWLARHTQVRHTLLVPGRRIQHPRVPCTRHYAAPLPFSHGYRCPLRKTPWTKTLISLRPDVIEVGGPYRLPSTALDAGRGLRIPVMGFYHSDTRTVLRKLLGETAGPAIDRYLRKLYNQFDLVLALSQCIRDSLREIGVEPTAWQPLGVDTTIFHRACRDPHLREQLGLARNARLLIYAGRFDEDKNINLLIDAAARLGKPHHLLLVGQQFSIKAPANVTWYPYQRNRRVLARLLASSDALVHAGNNETFGLLVIEVMSSGIPVVALNRKPINELVSARTGILVDRQDSRCFAAAIEALYTVDRHHLGRVARELAEQCWNWDALMPGLLAHCARLAAAHSMYNHFTS